MSGHDPGRDEDRVSTVSGPAPSRPGRLEGRDTGGTEGEKVNWRPVDQVHRTRGYREGSRRLTSKLDVDRNLRPATILSQTTVPSVVPTSVVGTFTRKREVNPFR